MSRDSHHHRLEGIKRSIPSLFHVYNRVKKKLQFRYDVMYILLFWRPTLLCHHKFIVRVRMLG